MFEESPYTSPSDSAAAQKPPAKLRGWFVFGFLIAFVGMLLFVRQFFHTGNALVQCQLWQFYLLEIRRFFTSSGTLGPTSGSGGRAVVMLLFQVGVSAIAGLICLGIGAIVRRFRK